MLVLMIFTAASLDANAAQIISNFGSHSAVSEDGNNLYIAYYDDLNTRLELAVAPKDTMIPTIRIIEEAGDVGEYPSVTYDSENIYISYFDRSDKEIRIAVVNKNNPNSFRTKRVIGIGEGQYMINYPNGFTSIAQDSRMIYIIYPDASKHLKLAAIIKENNINREQDFVGMTEVRIDRGETLYGGFDRLVSYGSITTDGQNAYIAFEDRGITLAKVSIDAAYRISTQTGTIYNLNDDTTDSKPSIYYNNGYLFVGYYDSFQNKLYLAKVYSRDFNAKERIEIAADGKYPLVTADNSNTYVGYLGYSAGIPSLLKVAKISNAAFSVSRTGVIDTEPNFGTINSIAQDSSSIYISYSHLPRPLKVAKIVKEDLRSIGGCSWVGWVGIGTLAESDRSNPGGYCQSRSCAKYCIGHERTTDRDALKCASTAIGSQEGSVTDIVCTDSTSSAPDTGGAALTRPAATGNPFIATCCGASEANCQEDDAEKKTVGQYVTLRGDTNYYCTEQEGAGSPKPGIFLTNLDPMPTENPQQRYQEAKTACINLAVANPSLASTPVWTGTKCCGEPFPDDQQWYYNDVTTAENRAGGDNTNDGACWDSAYKQNGQIIEGTGITAGSSKILSLGGEFLGCNLETTNENDNRLLGKRETGTTNLIIRTANNKPYCSKTDESPYYICAYNKRWWLLTGDDNAYTKTLRPGIDDGPASKTYVPKSVYEDAELRRSITPPHYPTQCCPADECWNPSIGETGKCVLPLSRADNEDKRVEAEMDNDGRKETGSFLCMLQGGNADWVFMHEKTPLIKGTPNGYCDTDDQCLVAVSETPRCIGLGEYYEIKDGQEDYGDNFCELSTQGGVWTSRTKFAAAQLARIAEDTNADYTLYCDSTDRVLNSLVGADGSASVNFRDLSGLTTNNVCVLKKRSGDDYQITIGLTLNKDLSEMDSQIRSAFGVGCGDINAVEASDDYKDTFHQCNSGDNKLWYNPRLNALVYNKNEVTMPRDGSSLLTNDPNNRIVFPMGSVLARIPELYPDYNTIYIARTGFRSINSDGRKIYNKNIYGFLNVETLRNDLGVLYDGVFANAGTACRLASAQSRTNNLPGDPERLQCFAEHPSVGNRAYIYSITLDPTSASSAKDLLVRDFADLTAKIRIR